MPNGGFAISAVASAADAALCGLIDGDKPSDIITSSLIALWEIIFICLFKKTRNLLSK